GKSAQILQSTSFSREIGRSAALAAVSPASNADDVLKTLYAEIERVRTEPVTAAELAEAKNELLAQSLSRRETAQGRGFELGEALVITGDPAAADKRLAAIAKVTAADVQRVAAKYYAPNARVELRYTQGPENPKAWANPAPMPIFASVAPATGEPLKLKDEKDRQPPPAPGAAPPLRQPAMAERKLD
ncbi:MAG: M16 family metallopeptidase, partial [Novosphingobium sp.]